MCATLLERPCLIKNNVSTLGSSSGKLVIGKSSLTTLDSKQKTHFCVCSVYNLLLLELTLDPTPKHKVEAQVW